MHRLYANENFPLPVVLELRRLGHDVLTTQDAGRSDQEMPDESVLAVACTDQRAVLTLNRWHFVRLHRERPDHSGIIVCTFDPDFAEQAARIHSAIGSQSSLAGQLIRVNRPSR